MTRYDVRKMQDGHGWEIVELQPVVVGWMQSADAAEAAAAWLVERAARADDRHAAAGQVVRPAPANGNAPPLPAAQETQRAASGRTEEDEARIEQAEEHVAARAAAPVPSAPVAPVAPPPPPPGFELNEEDTAAAWQELRAAGADAAADYLEQQTRDRQPEARRSTLETIGRPVAQPRAEPEPEDGAGPGGGRPFATLSKYGSPWTDDEDWALLDAASKGRALEVVADELGRPLSTCHTRLKKLQKAAAI